MIFNRRFERREGKAKMIDTTKVREHYSPQNLLQRLEKALTAAGLDDQTIPLNELAAADQFHALGLQATVELAALCKIKAGMRVLDVGAGLGGPARYLAKTFGCRVTGIDLSADFVAAARLLTARTGLADKVDYVEADALDTSFENDFFDLAWTQHAAMNIEDRPALYREIRRVLKPNGKLAIFDIVKGAGGELHFPLPWAETPATSFLLSSEEMRNVLTETGFEIVSWQNKTAQVLDWLTQQSAPMPKPDAAPPLLSLAALLGPGFTAAAANIARNLKENRGELLQAIVVRH